MFTVHQSGTRRAVRLWTALIAGAVFCAGMALESQGQPAPSNDDLTNCQPLVGISGGVQGTNLYATAEKGEPAPVPGVPAAAASTIWYSWTAPISTIIDFNTRNSTDPAGNTLSTVLAVYQLKPFATKLTFADLTPVASDEQDSNTNYPNTSRVDFSAAQGTTYWIQVGSTTNLVDGYGQGYPFLNWSPSLVAGGFGFSTSVFPVSSLEDFLIYDDPTGSIAPSLFNLPQGSPNARITVARTGGFMGMCEVTLNVSDGTYTNYYFTNFAITNVYITNYATYTNKPTGPGTNFTNILLTNIVSINYFNDYQFGGYTYLLIDNASNIYVTNANGTITIVTTNLPLSGLGLPDFFTNFPCPGDSSSVMNISNSDGSGTVIVSNVICLSVLTNAVVPSSSAGVQYTPMTQTLVFNDFQMSQDVYVQIYPILSEPNPQNLPTPGPEEIGNVLFGATNNVNLDYQYSGLDTIVNVSLTNAVLDPSENQDIVPPYVNPFTGAGNIHILNYWGNPNLTYSNVDILFQEGAYTLFNFERETFRCNKNCGTAVIFVQQTLDYGTPGSYTVSYTIDSLYPGITVVDDNGFATVAGSDYAIPYEAVGQPAEDFGAPENKDWNGTFGTLTFPPYDQSPEAIYIPIFENGAVEFDEDIELELFLTPGEAQSDAGQTPPGYLGAVNNARLTINFDNVFTNHVQPGGALDRTYNVDAEPFSYPPDNLVPGANSTVNAVVIDGAGRAIIAGDFDAYNTTPINYIARLQADSAGLTAGQMDTSFTNGLGRGPNGFVNVLAIDLAGRIILGGDFTAINGTNAYHIARLNGMGALDTNFFSGFGFNGTVYALAIDANGNVLAGGDFTSYNKTNCYHIARILPTGGLDPTFQPNSGAGASVGTDLDVHAVATDSFGHVILGGDFTMVNGSNWNHVARLLTNGVADPSFQPGIGADGSVYALAVQNNNSIILGGAFENFNLISRNSIARLASSGALDTAFDPGTGFNDVVNTVVLQPDGNILVGGQFTAYNTSRRVALARLQPNGWLDTSFMDTAYNQFAGLILPYYDEARNQVNAMGLQGNGNIVIGGYFYQVGGGFSRVDIHPRQNVARIIGTPTTGPENGGIGNYPGNIGLTQSPYTVDDIGEFLFITLNRQDGSLGPATLTLGTNTYPPSATSATSADFGLLGSVALYNTVWDALGPYSEAGDAWGWRVSDGEWGFNNGVQPDGDGAASLSLFIQNDPTAAPIIYASLAVLDLNARGLLSLGGVPIPLWPGLAQVGSQLDIINDNFPAGTLGFSATNYNVLESGSTVTITVLRTNGSYGNVTVYASTKNGTALQNIDYAPITNLYCEFPSGSNAFTFPITIYDHSTQQSNKFFHIYLSSPTGGASLDTSVPPLVPSNAVVTIIDDHFKPGYLSFSSPAYSVLKPGVATVTVNRSGAALGQVSVNCGTSDGTAINNVNYVGVTNTMSWSNQDISPRTITIQTLQDNEVEGPKTFNVFLFSPQVAGNSNPQTNAELLASPSNAVMTIEDTDSYGTLNFLVPNFEIQQNGGAATITVERTGGLVGSVSVNFQTYTPTNIQLPYLAAVANTNYSPTNGVLSFAPGVSGLTFTVPVIDTPYESNVADRIVGLQLFNGSPTNIAGQFPKTAVLTILDPQLHLNSAGSVDTTTQNGLGFNAFVNSLALQPDASLLAGGNFTYFNNYPFDYVARLLPSGAFDTGFLFNLAGANATVWQVLSLTPPTNLVDGDIMIVGDFNQADQVNSPKIARLSLNGGLDTSFNPGSGADGTVYTITQMYLPASATNLANVPYYVIGGAFANFDGAPAGGVARLTQAGAMDPNFNLGLGVSGSNGIVHALAITAGNQILVAGDFTSFDNAAHHSLVRLNVDGSLDTNFTAFDGILSDINGPVRAMLVQPDGRIIIGGLFTMVNGSNYNYIARLNSDGSTDTNFNVGVGCNNTVQALALDDQLHILVGGDFTQASGVTRFSLTRLNPDGTVDPTINFGYGANGFVDTIVLQTNGEIDVGGGFTTFNNIPENNFVRLYGGANYGVGSVQFGQQSYGVLENASNALITLQRLGGEGTPDNPQASAIFFTSNITALSGRDYMGVTNTVTFPLGETFETVTVPISNNFALAPNLEVGLELASGPSTNTTIGPQVSAVLIITNVNTGVEFSAQAYRQSADAPSGSAAIPVVRVGNPNTTVTVTVYTGTNGTAGPFVNYIPTTNVLFFDVGEMTNYFLVPVLNSPTTFADTTVDLEMEDVTNAIIASPSSATLTIGSVLSGPGFLVFSQPSYTVTNVVGDEMATNAVIFILRTNGSANTVTVNLSTSNGTAIAGINYSNISDQLTFFNGQTVATDNIPIIKLTNAVPNLTFYLNLSNPGNGAVISGPATVPVTIVNDIANFAFSSSSYFVNEGAGTVTISILRAGPTNGTATVFYTTYSPTNAADTNGYAVPNVDYVPASGTLSFAPGVTLQTIPVTILQGTAVNGVETFQVLLQNPSPVPGTQIGVPGTTTVGIISDVSGFSLATNAYYVGENGSNVLITVNRANPLTGSLSVRFATSDGTALNGVDYVATNGTLHFIDTQATNSFSVQILNPNLVESNKSFNITLSNPTTNSYLVSPSNAVVTITNVYVGLAFASPSFSVSECSAQAAIPVVLTGLTNSTIGVNCATADGSGVAGVNYVAASTNLQFLPGQTVAYFDVAPINNHIIGPDHTVVLNLSAYQQVLTNVAGVLLLNPSTALLTIQECNGAYIVKSGTAFVTGSIEPSAGVLYSNDTVTILFGLRDIAGGNTSNLVATLLQTNGITNVVTAQQNYGVLIEYGPTVAKPFTFTAMGTNGQNIIATLALQDGARDLGTVSFGFTLGGGTVSLANTNAIFLPESTNPPTIASNSIPPGYGYPSMINVSGIAGALTKVTATLSNFGHSFPSDVDVLLEAPNGSNSILMSHCGGSSNVTNVTLTFDQTTNIYLSLVNQLTNGTFLPTTNALLQMPTLPTVPTNESVTVAAPQSPYPYGANLSTFLGASPNGTWSLWAMCDKKMDSGYISNGWSLNLSTGVPVENDSDLEVTVATTPVAATVSNLLTYYLTVTNFGPSAATNVVITDYLPPGATYQANRPPAPSSGSVSFSDGVLTVSLPSLAVGTGTAFDITVTPTELGYITNVVTALALEPDPNTNNMVTNVNLVSPPSADVAVNLTGAPNPALIGGTVVFSIEVLNNGPSTATGATATAVVPPGFVVLSNGIVAVDNGITQVLTTNADGSITWNIGDITNGTVETMTVETEALTAGIGLFSVSAESPVYDPLKGNNFASVKIEVDQPMLSISAATQSYQLTWPAQATNYVLQGAANLPPQGTWANLSVPPASGGFYTVPLPTNGYHFFRLKTQVP
jgi:uncharacterized delta-60 repeat protein/uncharacterized repeat protein (TIGR01451 family)